MKIFTDKSMEVQVFDTREAMGEAAGKDVEDKILELLSRQKYIRMIFAAAPSQEELLSYLRGSSKIPWNRITAFHMDEYVGLSADAPQLFSNFLKRHLFDHVDFKAVHLMDGNRNSIEECKRYSALLTEEPIDIVCLGIGENGHIAFNDPPAYIDDPETMKLVDLDQACQQQQVNDGCFSSLDQVPQQALTLTIPTLMQGNYLFCVVPGKSKREAVFKTLNHAVSPACPASYLQRHEKCKLFLDADSYGENEHQQKSASPDLQEGLRCINCLSGEPEYVALPNGINEDISIEETLENEASRYVGPGLVDLQVNGINGIDFNDVSLIPKQLLEATEYLLIVGVTTFFPTIITNSDENILQILKTIRKACENYPLVDSCIGGIHLEGPFISPEDGPRGAHDKQYIKAPDWSLIVKCQAASGGRIKLITLAPELEGTAEFIQKCRKGGIHVSIGHSNATSEQIDLAVKAGAILSTHLGNGVSLTLDRHPNLLWEQLAQDDLFTSIIADGFHLPNSFLKLVIRIKGDKALLVSDATCFSGMAPGVYKTHIGDEVVLHENGRLALYQTPRLLAGATKCLLENIEHLTSQGLATLADAWKMASVTPVKFLNENNSGPFLSEFVDRVIFTVEKEGKISVSKVIKDGQIVFEKKAALSM